MTDESDAEDVIYQHTLMWRSKALIRKLDKRQPNRDGNGQFKKRELADT
jgi:hypothetical protein